MKARINDELQVRSISGSAGTLMGLDAWDYRADEDGPMAALTFDEVAALRDACNEHLEEWGR